ALGGILPRGPRDLPAPPAEPPDLVRPMLPTVRRALRVHVDAARDHPGRPARRSRAALIDSRIDAAPPRGLDGGMRILLKFTIDTDADAAWRALHSPTVLAEIYGPFLTVEPLDPAEAEVVAVDPDPRRSAAVQLGLLGRVPLGRQLISVSDRTRTLGGQTVRILRDSG